MSFAWWFNSGDRGWIDCGAGHRAGRGWMFRGPRGRLFCRPCALRLFKVAPPPLINWPGWSPSKPPGQNHLHNRPAGVAR